MRTLHLSSQNIKNKTILDVLHVKSRDQIADVFTKSGVKTDRILNVIRTGTLKVKHDQMSTDMPLNRLDMISPSENFDSQQNFLAFSEEQAQKDQDNQKRKLAE